MQNIVVTDSGSELITKAMSGETTMTFTRIAVSDCDYSEIDVKKIKDLQQIKQTVPISKISRLDKNTVEIIAAIENRQIDESYFVYALGIYAKDSKENEILYGVSLCEENPDYMPAYEGKTLSGISYRLDIALSDSEQVVLEVNPAAVATAVQVEQVQSDLTRHIQDNSIHVTEAKQKKWDTVEEKVDKSDVVNNLVTTEEGKAADARQLNKSIEGTFAYALNTDLAKIKELISLTQANFSDATNLIGKNQNYFIIHGANLPSGESTHGMLFCRYFNGYHFAPTSSNQAEPITKQIFMPYNNDNLYTRTYNHGTNKWTSWTKH